MINFNQERLNFLQSMNMLPLRILRYTNAIAIRPKLDSLLVSSGGLERQMLAKGFTTSSWFGTQSSSSDGAGGGGNNNNKGGDGKNKNGQFDKDGFSMELDEKAKEKLDNFKKVISKNSYYEKYKAKIVEAQKSSPKSFTAVIDTVITAGKKAVGMNQPKLKGPQKKDLDSIMKLDKLLQVDKEDISFIWAEYHRASKLLAGTMSNGMHDRIVLNGRAYKSFVLPLPRNAGCEYFLTEFSNDAFYFTPLAMFQKHHDNSPVCISVVHYTELRDTKEIVLMRGEYDKDYLSMDEAATLVIQLNLYYGEPTDKRLELLSCFNHRPQEFDHLVLLTELKQLKLDYPHLFPEEGIPD